MAKRIQKKKKLKKYFEIIKFLAILNLFLIPLYLVLWLNLSYQPLQNFLAYATGTILAARGYNVFVNEDTINLLIGLELQRIQISWDSTGWKSMYFLMALALATPKVLWKRKLKFLLWSIPTVFLLNFIRILTTILFATSYGFCYFEIVHTILWREGMILAVVFLWFLFFKGKI
jgi:exosortase/archaeosortase family protein